MARKKIITLALCATLILGSSLSVCAEGVDSSTITDAATMQAYIDALPLADQCTLYAAANKVGNYIEADITTTPYTYLLTEDGIVITGFSETLTGIVTIAPTYTVDGISYPVTKIGYRAFYKQINITALILPEGLTSIGRAAFMDCVAMQIVYLPSTLTTINDYAFRNCVLLSDTYYPYNYTEWNAMQMGDYNTLLVDAVRHYNTSK